MITYYSPTKIVIGGGSLSKLGELVKELGSRAYVLFSRSFARRFGYVERIKELLEAEGIKVGIYEGIKPNPPISQCDEVAKKVREFSAEVVIGFGGGSVMDAAKAVAVVAVRGGSASDYVLPKVVEGGDALPVVAVPTTCGTGSEVTRYAMLTDEVSKRKVTMVGSSIIPKVAIVDPEVLKHLPKEMIKWTSLDAFSHAIESYASVNSNPLSDSHALLAMKLIVENIVDAVEGDFKALKNLHIASTLAGLAINSTGTTALHALGYYLTTHHGVQHGLANAVLMPYVMDINLRAIEPTKVDALALLLRTQGVDGIVASIKVLLKKLGIPSTIKELGVSKDELRNYAEVVKGYSRNLSNNPVKVDDEYLMNVLTRAYEGK